MYVHHHALREGSRGLRAFLHVRRHDNSGELLNGQFEGYIASGARHAGIGLSVHEDTSGVQLFAGVPKVANVWVAVGSNTLRGWVYKRYGRALPEVNIADLRFHGRAVWWEVWHDKWSHHRDTPRWRSGNFHWWDALVGKAVHEREVLEANIPCVVPMSEGVYQARCTLERRTWKRARWPYPQVVYGYDIDILSRPGPDGPYLPEGVSIDDKHVDGYIPVPGKGENAWDCGGDGTFSMSGPGRTVETAVADVVKTSLRDRRRRGAPADYADAIEDTST